MQINYDSAPAFSEKKKLADFWGRGNHQVAADQKVSQESRAQAELEGTLQQYLEAQITDVNEILSSGRYESYMKVERLPDKAIVRVGYLPRGEAEKVSGLIYEYASGFLTLDTVVDEQRIERHIYNAYTVVITL